MQWFGATKEDKVAKCGAKAKTRTLEGVPQSQTHQQGERQSFVAGVIQKITGTDRQGQEENGSNRLKVKCVQLC